MSRRNSFIIRLVLMIGLVVGLIMFIFRKGDTFDVLSHTNFSIIAGIFATYALNYIFLGMVYNFPLKKMDISLSFNQWFGLTNLSNLFNLILPAKGGTAIRWLYLWEVHKLPTQNFFSINLFGTAVGMITMGYLGLLVSYFVPGMTSSIVSDMDAAFWALFLAGSSIIVFMSRNSIKRFKIFSPLPEELKDWKIFSSTAICFAGITLLYPVRTYLSYHSLGIQIGLVEGIEISMIALLISIVPILPGNIGVKELAMAYIAKRYGISAEMAILASLIERAGLYLFLLPFGFLAYFSVFMNIKGKRSFSDIAGLMTKSQVAREAHE